MGRPSTWRAAPSTRTVGPCSVRVSEASDDPDWDAFLETTTHSPYMQSSCWGRVRATMGWPATRLVVWEGGRIVAGVQLLMRPMPIGGHVGRVSWGPVILEERPHLAETVINEMIALAKAKGVRYLAVNPPPSGDPTRDVLVRLGFRPSPYQLEYTTTISIDLRPNLDEMLLKMRRITRRYLRSEDRHALTVRRGSAADLPTFHRLKDAHAARLGYHRRSQEYYSELWRAFAPHGHVELFLAEYGGEPVSAALVMPFGDTCYGMDQPWSGEHGDLRPNEVLEWHLCRWAKAEGYRYFDLGGINRPAAEAILAGNRELARLAGWESFKLGFGGKLTLLPEGYDYVCNPVLRFAYRSIPRTMLPSLSGVVDRARVRVWGRRET